MVKKSSQLYPQDTNSLGLYTDKIRNLPEEKFGFVIVKFILKFLVVINIPLVFLWKLYT